MNDSALYLGAMTGAMTGTMTGAMTGTMTGAMTGTMTHGMPSFSKGSPMIVGVCL